jgi:hypothetical protein
MASINWKTRSGRTSGPSGYQFGDISRSIFTRTRSWGEKSGRQNSDEQRGYVFGDVSRTIVGVATAVKHDVRPIVQSLLNNNRIHMQYEAHHNEDNYQGNVSENSAVAASNNATNQHSDTHQNPPLLFSSFNDLMLQISSDGYQSDTIWPQSALAQSIWTSFMNASYLVSHQAQKQNILSAEDLASAEPYLFLGIPALTALECSIRSAKSDGMVLIDGKTIISWEANIDSLSKDEKNLFIQLKNLTKLLEIKISELNEENIEKLRMKVVHASGDIIHCIDNSQDILANQICSSTLAIATDVSQLYFFQKAFMFVMEKLEEGEGE